MRIAVNLRLYVQGKIGGLENYVRHVVSGVAADQARKGQPLTVFAHQAEVENVRAITPDARIIPVVHETAVPVIEAELDRGNYDLLFCPLLVLDPLKPKIPSAVMMPDLQHEFFPDFFDPNTLQWRRQTYRPSVLHANLIYTLSEYSKKTIVDKFQINPEKIEVIYLDVDKEFDDSADPTALVAFQSLRLPKDYLFFPANFWPHKNHVTLLRAMQMLVRSHFPELGLVFTGAPSTDLERIKKEIATLGLKKNVRVLGYQERRIIVELYRHAHALVFVSRFEGFGIPILEAFHTGTPVITSRVGSCQEVAAGAALLVDELDPASIAAGVEQVLEDPGLCQQLIEKGKARARQFSWQRAIELTLASFERITTMPSHSALQVTVQEYPLVSIVTPSFNMARFLEETIQSVLTQNYPHIDYIVMDGDSTDGSVDILRKYEGQLRYESRPDRGQADAINRGFAISRGSIFTYLNADDTYLPGAVETVVRHMLANPSAGVVYGEAYYVHEDGQMIGRYPTLPFDPQLLSRTCYICQPAAFMWRDVFEAAGGMNVEQHFALDYDLWIRIAKLYPMLKVDEYLATSRMHRENKTLRARRQVYREILSVTKTHYGYVSHNWLYGYACYLVDGKDQFFEPSRPSLAKLGLSLVLGSYHNFQHMIRYWKDLAVQMGAIGQFQGRWTDGWISKRYVAEYAISESCTRIHITGRHLAPFENGLWLTIRLNGKTLKKEHVQKHGPFAIEVECPTEMRAKSGRIEIESNRTFRPVTNGDYRKLSYILDAVMFNDS